MKLHPVDIWLLALVAVREAGGEGAVGMAAVIWVVLNRIRMGRWGTTVYDVVTAHDQFSSFTIRGDAMTVRWPTDADMTSAEAIAQKVVSGGAPDPTRGATDYCNLSVAQPSWAKVYTKVAQIGHHTFFVRPA